MISDELEPARWLAQARAQSQRLAEARARQPRPWRRAARPLHRLQLALAGAVALLLLASGAWALVSRAHPPLPSSPAVSPPASYPAEVRGLAPQVTVPPAKNQPRKHKKRSISPPMNLEDGDGELILVAPHQPPAPLFSPEEWKHRGGTLQP